MPQRSKPSRRGGSGPAVRRGVRIIGGRWKRTVLDVVDAPGLRPTPDRVRETLFNWLTHALDDGLGGRVVLDLFAGSGALGFEAASRGAARVLMVDNDPRALAALTAARDRLGAADRVEIRSGEALRVGMSLRDRGERFDLIFLDPPFGHGWLDNALPLAAALCKPSGFVYVEAEQALDAAAVTVSGLECYRRESAGEVFYHLLQRNKKIHEETEC